MNNKYEFVHYDEVFGSLIMKATTWGEVVSELYCDGFVNSGKRKVVKRTYKWISDEPQIIDTDYEIRIMKRKNFKKLYDIALVAAGKENKFETTHLDVAEKFAELVVFSCIDEFISQMWFCGIDESNNPRFYKAIDRVKESFGYEKNCTMDQE